MGVTITVPTELLVAVGAGAAVAAFITYRTSATRQLELHEEVSMPRPSPKMINAQMSQRSLERQRSMNEEIERAQIPMRVPNQVPSMEDAMQSQETAKSQLGKLTPQMVLQNLQQGNARFWMGIAQRPELNAMERRAMIMQQFPKAAILGCSDSRVPIEIVFDQGLGDIFAIRVAGNAYGTGVAASIDYAVNHLKVKVVVVLGHEGCGAVRAAMLPSEEIGNEPEHLRKWLKDIRRGLAGHEGLNKQLISDLRARDREAVITNVRAQMITVASQPNIRQRVEKGELIVVGAFYEITSGMVDFITSGEINAVKPTLSENMTPAATPTLSRRESKGSAPRSGPTPPSIRAAGAFDGSGADASAPSCQPCDTE